jgi:hypothetical protein
MTFSLILLGTLLILTIFGVGEKILKKLKINKILIISLLALSIILYFVPPLVINGITFTWVGFVLPLIFSMVILLSNKKLKYVFKMFFVTLFSFSVGIVYNLIKFNVYESALLQPYIFLGIIFGLFSLSIIKDPLKLYASTFVGFVSSEIVYYLSSSVAYRNGGLVVGGEKVLTVLILTFLVSVITNYFAISLKKHLIRTKLRRSKNLENSN